MWGTRQHSTGSMSGRDLRTVLPMPCAHAAQVHAKSSKVIEYDVSNVQLTEELKRNDDKYQELKRKAKMEKLQAQGM